MCPSYQAPTVSNTSSDLLSHTMDLTTRVSTPNMELGGSFHTKNDNGRWSRQTSPARSTGSRLQVTSRRHTGLPQGPRSTRGHFRASSSDGEMEDYRRGRNSDVAQSGEAVKANHARPRSPFSSSRQSERSALAEMSHARRQNLAKDAVRESSPSSRVRPDALMFLDEDSPALTEERIQRTVEAAGLWHGHSRSASPRSSACSASPSSFRSGDVSDQDTDTHTTPEQSINGDIVATTFTQMGTSESRSRADARASRREQRATSKTQSKDKAHRYGTPEMPRGNANLPHLPTNALTPRVSNPGQGHVKHLPRAEKLPLTGYELLASRLSGNSGRERSRSRRQGRYQSSEPSSPGSDYGRTAPEQNEPEIKPIYRRFEALNHRLLLHLQDELSELEEQLHRLDTADTQTRRLQNCILPASRRAEHMAGGELQWHKTDILGKIGFKLGQYNHALSSFTQTQVIPSPDVADVETYRTYLATENPIAEIETRFLESTEDLVTLAPNGGAGRSRASSSYSSPDRSRDGTYSPAVLSDEAATPRQGSVVGLSSKASRFMFSGAPGVGFLPTPSLSPVSSVAGESRPATSAGPGEVIVQLADEPSLVKDTGFCMLVFALAVAALLPVLAVLAIDGFVARLATLLVLVTVVGFLGHFLAVGEKPTYRGLGNRELLVCLGVYGAIMAVVAGVC